MLNTKALSTALLGGVLAGASAFAGTPSPAGASVYFISPSDNATLKSPVSVVFGLRRMGVAPAGVQHGKTGHHHLIIDSALPPLDMPIPVDANHRHLDGGQTQTEIKLPPGRHTLQLLLGDFAHLPHDKPVASQRITIVVEQ